MHKIFKNKWVQLVLMFAIMLFISGEYLKHALTSKVYEVYNQGWDDAMATVLMNGRVILDRPDSGYVVQGDIFTDSYNWTLKYGCVTVCNWSDFGMNCTVYKSG